MPVAGEATARRAVAEKLRRENGIDCTPEDVIITTGAKHAIYLALQCLLDPGQGQEVLLPAPAWVSYRPMIELAGGTAVELPSAIDNDFKITPLQLEQAVNERTAAIIINSPSNPCGTMYRPEELEALGEVLAAHEGVTILCDEIYEKLVFGGIRHFSLGSLKPLADRVVTINGLSKSYAMTGWRLGYAAAPGSPLAKAMIKLQGQTTTNVTSFTYAAVTQALTKGAASIERMRQAFAGRARVIYDLLTAMPGVRCARPTGAFYAFPEVLAAFGRRSPGGRTIDSSISFAEALLEETGVAVVPGAEFGECGEGHVRLSFACSEDQIREGCRRMAAWLR
jgi:aspartate aminotransferase